MIEDKYSYNSVVVANILGLAYIILKGIFPQDSMNKNNKKYG